MKQMYVLLVLLVTFLVVSCDDGDVKKNNNNQNNNNQNNHSSVCGNGIVEVGETCDGTALGGATCENINQGFTGGELACTTQCTLDTSGCTTSCQDACELDNRVCDGNTLRVCEANVETGCTEWVNTDCTATSQTCQIINNTPQCAACVDACTLNEERCNANSNGIETCVVGALGCTEWSNTACDVATPVCEVQNGSPVCVASCVDACTLNEKRCNANSNGIETCVVGALGCTEWSNTACDVATPVCEVQNGSPVCVMVNGSGDSCSDVYVITVPFYTEGTDFTVDFPTNDMTFTDSSCDLGYTVSGVDAVFAVSLQQDEAIIFAQGGGLDGLLYIQGVCDATGTCYDVVDDGVSNQTESILFQAPADGTYYLIVKAYSSSPITTSYTIGVWTYEDPAELTCDDGFDNDLDGKNDCEDSNCFGVGTCTVETVCGDGQDNDADGVIDCFDTDCSGVEPCGAENTEERCSDGVDNDADGVVDCDDSDCASMTACQVGQTCAAPQEITTFPYTVSGSDITADFNNAHTFTGTGCTTGNGVEAVFAVTLTAGERIRLDETGGLDAVLRVINPCDNATTCLLSKDSPETNQVFTAPANGTYYVILESWSASPSTRDYNFTITLLSDSEVGLCGDNVDNDADGVTDCFDSDCTGDSACPSLVWQENFDGGTLPTWTIVGSVWEMGEVTGTYTSGPASCLSTPNCAATQLNDAYSANMAWDDHCLETSDLDLTSYTTAILTFSGWMKGEGPSYDGGRVQVYNGSNWENPTTVAPTYNATIGGQSAWVFTDSMWRDYGIVLTPYVGSTIKVRFCWRSDFSFQYAGWYIDNVKLLAQ